MTDIVYVDENDNEIGSGTIDNALQRGIIRRVSRVILTNDVGNVLLQKRSATILSYPNFWNDSASGHVDVGETYREAALRETKEEMGVEGVELAEIGTFYGEEQEAALVRKAFNTVFTGVYNKDPVIDPYEVSEFAWVTKEALRARLEKSPHEFPPDSVRSLTLFLTWSSS